MVKLWALQHERYGYDKTEATNSINYSDFNKDKQLPFLIVSNYSISKLITCLNTAPGLHNPFWIVF